MTHPENTPDPADGYEDGIVAPPTDVPLAVESYGTTPAEEEAGEPLESKLARERPDTPDAVDAGVGRLMQPDEGAHSDRESEEVAELVDDRDDLTAEEAAIHLEPER